MLGIKKKLTDAVDGSGGSKPVPNKETKSDLNSEVENAFDQVERRPLLSDVRATRAKAPGIVVYPVTNLFIKKFSLY